MIDYPLATVALFDPTCGDLPRRRLDQDRLKRYLSRLVDAGASSFLIGSSTGQGHLRTPDELESFFRCAADGRGEDAKLMGLLRPEDGIEKNGQLLSLLKELGYSLVYLRPATGQMGLDDDQVIAQLTPLVKLADEIGIPVGLYSISDVSGAPLTASAVARMLEGPGGNNIVAVKVTEADFESSTKQFLTHQDLQHLKIVQGWDPHLARVMRYGRETAGHGDRCGVTSGAMSFAVFQYLHLLSACQRCDWPEVEASQSALTALFHSMQDDPSRFADLQRAKYMMGLGHPIIDRIHPHQTDRVVVALKALPRARDRYRLAASLDLMKDGPLHETLVSILEDSASTV